MLTLDDLTDELRQALIPPPPPEEACQKTCAILQRYALNKVVLPDRLRQPGAECYSRHLVYKHEEDGFCLVGMVWSPGQGTAIHDHGGTWCVEGCMEGNLAITSYRISDAAEPLHRVRLEKEEYTEVGCGSVGCLIPPFEHHRIHNPFERTAITLHVYGQELTNCTRYLEDSPEIYRREKVPLSYTTYPTDA